MVLNTAELTVADKIDLYGSLSFYHPNLDSALLFAKKSLSLAEEINDRVKQAEALEEISHVERLLGNNMKSIQATFKALRVYESLNLPEKQAASFNQLATNYIVEENYGKAVTYLKQAIVIYSETDNREDHASSFLNLGEAYRLSGELDSAQTAFKKAIELNSFIQNKSINSYATGNLGMTYNAQDSLAIAKVHLKRAILVLTELEDFYATSVYLVELGDVHQKEGDFKTAEENYLKAMALAENAGLKEQIRDFSEKLTAFYESQGDYSLALQYQRLFQVYQDSLVNRANIQEIERLKAGYEIDKRESEIGLLNKVNTNQKYLLWALAGGVLASLLFLYLLYRGNQKIKSANTNLSEQKKIISQREQEKALLLKELNHRVKNNLQMISSLLSLQSRELAGHPAKAALETGKDRVEALSLVHRKLYQEGAETRVLLNEYLEELVLGLFYGYDVPFTPKFELASTTISVDTAVPLALIVNELVVNSLKYAYKDVEKPSLILKLETVDENLTIEIIDNGKGFNVAESKKKNAFGLKLIHSLIEQLEGTINKLDEKGTHWQVHLKVA